MFAVLWDASENWRGVRITAETVQHIRSLRQVRADQDTEERVA
jgi:hypothetical protein